MSHKQWSLLGKLALHWNTVIVACLNFASRTNSNCTTLQEAFSDSQGGNFSSLYLAGAEYAFHSMPSLMTLICAGSSTTCYVSTYFPATPSSLVSSSSRLLLSNPSSKIRAILAEKQIGPCSFPFKTQQRLPVVLQVKSQLLVWFILHLDPLPGPQSKEHWTWNDSIEIGWWADRGSL